MPRMPRSATVPGKRRRSDVKVNGCKVVEPVKVTRRVIDGQEFIVKVLPSQCEAAMAESRMIWGDLPRKRNILGAGVRV